MTKPPSKRKSVEAPAEIEKPVLAAVDVAARYQTTKEILLQARAHQFEYGKWLLASILAVHGGSLLAMSQAGDARERLYEASGPYLIYGLAAALVSGGAAWFNFTFASAAYFGWLTELRLGQEPQVSDNIKRAVNWSMYAAVSLATISLILFVVAAVTATEALKVQTKTYWYQTETPADNPKAKM